MTTPEGENKMAIDQVPEREVLNVEPESSGSQWQVSADLPGPRGAGRG